MAVAVDETALLFGLVGAMTEVLSSIYVVLPRRRRPPASGVFVVGHGVYAMTARLARFRSHFRTPPRR